MPSYNPNEWNDDFLVTLNNNCYNYACDIRDDTYAQPGYASTGIPMTLTCNDVATAAIADGLLSCPGSCEQCPTDHHKVALVIDPGWDFHWYRQDSNGLWSHKPGHDAATNTDYSDNLIADPQVADRERYTDFCGYFCVHKPSVVIDGPGPYGFVLP